jgi:hypothetical protein
MGGLYRTDPRAAPADPAEAKAAQRRRTELSRELRGASAVGESLEVHRAKRDVLGDEWTRWFREEANRRGIEALQLIPDGFARLQQTLSDQMAGEIRKLKTQLRKSMEIIR